MKAIEIHASVAIALVGLVATCSKSDHGANHTAPAPNGSSASGNTTRTSIIEIPAGLSAAQQAAAQQARDALSAACAKTPFDRNDFSEVTLTTSNASGYLKDRFDWDLVVTVAFVYKEGLDQRRGGHRVTFDMGAGNRPGIVTRKPQGIQLCGFVGSARGVASDKPCDPQGAEDCILDVPALKVLDATRPAAVVESQRIAPMYPLHEARP
jgi:hypothetical protein